MAVSADPFRISAVYVLVCAAFAAVVSGCQPQDTIKSYSAPKETKPAVADSKAAAPQGEPTDRMLAAIVPSGDQAWFFKVVGAMPAVDTHEKELNDFFTTVRFSSDGKPVWKLPEGWKDEPSNSAMRFATIIVPAEPKPLEITVSALPWSGTQDDLLRNVNRWRGQLQLPPVGAEQIGDMAREAKAGDVPIKIVDLRGHFAGSGMTPPFAGPIAKPGGAQGTQPELPPGHPPIADTPPNNAATSPTDSTNSTPKPVAPPTNAEIAPPEDIKFTVPAGWKQLPVSGMRKAAFAVADAEHGALVTLINFPADAGPMIADPLQNINRWRREVGLPDIKHEEVATASESVEIDGLPATLVRAIPDGSQSEQSQANLGTLAAMAKSGNKIWFIKLTGDRTVVASQEDAFKSFLKSLRFTAGGGATDGHN
jgi:hypothetical protein